MFVKYHQAVVQQRCLYDIVSSSLGRQRPSSLSTQMCGSGLFYVLGIAKVRPDNEGRERGVFLEERRVRKRGKKVKGVVIRRVKDKDREHAAGLHGPYIDVGPTTRRLLGDFRGGRFFKETIPMPGGPQGHGAGPHAHGAARAAADEQETEAGSDSEHSEPEEPGAPPGGGEEGAGAEAADAGNNAH